jgi:poly(hydroxyalkanoate) depolymerase family esterase
MAPPARLKLRRFILKIPAGLLHATRLVQGGKLIAATNAIQRALRGEGSPSAAPAEAIEGSFHRVSPAAGSAAHEPLAPRPRRDPPPCGVGRFVARTYAGAPGMREYKIYVPACHSGQALPLVVMLHGCKQGIDDFAAGTRMNVLAEERGFLVVYPAQASKANGSNCWNWFQPEHQQREGGEPSLIAEITREVMSEYRVDPQRVYVAGLSAGGAMAAIMGTTYPDLYAAVGIHSGLAYAAAGDVASAFAAMHGNNPNRKRTPRREASAAAMPTIVFHGDNDTTVHPSNGEDVIAQAMSASISGASHTAERGDASGRAYTRTTYRDAAGKPVTEHWLVHGAAHAWSGGSREGSYTDPRGPDASREMVRFFLQHHTG